MLITFDALGVNVILVKSEVWIRSNRVKVPRVVFSGEGFSARNTGFLGISQANELVKHFLKLSAVLADALYIFPHSLNFPFGFFSLC
jgi:hypothetical protein